MAVLKMYRGISVASKNVELVKRKINSDGLMQSHELPWSSYILDLRLNLAELLNRPDLSTSHTRFYKPGQCITSESVRQRNLPFPFIFACGDKTGAAYFANTHNRTEEKDFPLVIEFLAPVEDVFVDGKDFLYSVFEGGPRQGLREKILKCFGVEISKYLDKAWNSRKTEHRIAMCDLAVQDPEIVFSHYQNRMTIGGRRGTVFRSAFMVRSPIDFDRILSVHRANPCYEAPSFSIHDFKNKPSMTMPEVFRKFG
ncbi:hypothetical protein [Desulfomonile tiedjei]|uniref:Uncharacterized protein n=1 Tax=Desulfomonile tiedjei (strain ATCC 49306 / DSM 6799 / DCB-1) TaxID=706587 RepID=I4CC81_DESTA|nr:hypothetical protein [Desulfomonile tiedjei]AFM27172.1 hypothetical protein Desti_4544 [Desulfomonile tiedjei DSM 6799]